MIAVNQIPVRLETKDGQTKWRGIKDFEHTTLCNAFSLDPIRFYFDLPSSCRGTGSLSTGNRGNRVINGYVFMHGQYEPFGKVTVCNTGERFRDVDPSDMQEFLKLS
jgi:hypothetical protein